MGQCVGLSTGSTSQDQSLQIESTAGSEFGWHNSLSVCPKYIGAAFVLLATSAWQLDAERVANANCTAKP